MPNNMGEATVDEVALDIITDTKNGLKPTMDALVTKTTSHVIVSQQKQRGKFN